MSIDVLSRVGIGLCLILSSATSASATTYVVSSSGGGQFTDIQPAIDAAQPGDVLLVMNGTYGAYTLTKGLSIIGYGAPTVAGAAMILAVPAGETAVVVNVTPSHLTIGGCMGPVLVQDFKPMNRVDVQQSADVRLRRLKLQPPDGPGVDGCDVDGSRVEIAKCTVQGSVIQTCTNPSNFPGGGRGMTLSNSSRVHVALADVFGGSGAHCFNHAMFGGDGGDGIRLGPGDTLILAGGGASSIFGGEGGGDQNDTGDCFNDGAPGQGINNQGGDLWHSGAYIVNPGGYQGVHCIFFPTTIGTGPTFVTPEDPTLDASGEPTVGGSVQLTLRAPPGASAILYFGRHAIVVQTPDARVEQLTQKSRIVDLGTIPASGLATFDLPLRANLQPGTLLIAQAEVTLPSGRLRRTNSVPIVVR